MLASVPGSEGGGSSFEPAGVGIVVPECTLAGDMDVRFASRTGAEGLIDPGPNGSDGGGSFSPVGLLPVAGRPPGDCGSYGGNGRRGPAGGSAFSPGGRVGGAFGAVLVSVPGVALFVAAGTRTGGSSRGALGGGAFRSSSSGGGVSNLGS